MYLFAAALAALLPACGSTDDPPPADDPISRGAQVWKTNECASCHAESAAGAQGPNITNSVTAGIGSWTYQQFHDAVRLGNDKDGTKLCLLMSTFDTTMISEAGMQDLHAYIKSKPVSDVKNTGSYCP
jgi:cytochrome c553